MFAFIIQCLLIIIAISNSLQSGMTTIKFLVALGKMSILSSLPTFFERTVAASCKCMRLDKYLLIFKYFCKPVSWLLCCCLRNKFPLGHFQLLLYLIFSLTRNCSDVPPQHYGGSIIFDE